MVFRHSERSSHAIIGAIAGAAIAASGFATLNYKGFIKILEALILSPIIAFVLGFIVYSIVKLIFKDSNLAKTNKRFRRVQILTVAIQSYTHGTNDAQKAMGIITMALMTANLHKSDAIPFGCASCALAMGLGTSIGGWKIIKTVGGKIMKIRPVNGVSADLTGAYRLFSGPRLFISLSARRMSFRLPFSVWALPTA